MHDTHINVIFANQNKKLFLCHHLDTKIVGPLMPSPAQPLSEELEEFMQSAGDDGVILVSFGTYLRSLDENLIKLMATALSRLPQKIIWKIKKGM